MNEPIDDEDDLDLPKSKSQIKREMLALTALGEKLSKLPAKQLNDMPLDQDTKEEVEKIRDMAHREARRRELRYLGKMLREADMDALEKALSDLEKGSKQKARDFQSLEKLRDDIIENPTEGIAQALEKFPTADRQYLAQLARNAAKELKAEKPPANARKLFKYLRDQFEQL